MADASYKFQQDGGFNPRPVDIDIKVKEVGVMKVYYVWVMYVCLRRCIDTCLSRKTARSMQSEVQVSFQRSAEIGMVYLHVSNSGRREMFGAASIY